MRLSQRPRAPVQQYGRAADASESASKVEIEAPEPLRRLQPTRLALPPTPPPACPAARAATASHLDSMESAGVDHYEQDASQCQGDGQEHGFEPTVVGRRDAI